MIGLVDYGMGNLRSVEKALQTLGADVQIVKTASALASADRVVLPGVGAFGDAMTHLHQQSLVEPLVEFIQQGRPFLGICLGMQLLFDASQEGQSDGKTVAGLGVLPGQVVPFCLDDPKLKVPHMGWNRVVENKNLAGGPSVLSEGLEAATGGMHVYFVHGYHVQPVDPSVVSMRCDYGGDFCAAVQKDHVMAVQFHPEKSQRTGLAMLKRFIDFTA